MSDQQFDVFFRGDIVAGQAVAEVKERLAGLFKLDAAQVEQLFSAARPPFDAIWMRPALKSTSRCC